MEWHCTRRRPVWQPSRLSRLKAFLKDALGRITLGRVALAILVLPLLFYVYREVTRDVVIIDPFTVPKHFEEAGLTGEVMANRIGDRLRQIEIATQTRMKKDNLTSLREEGSVPDVEIPGTKLGLKTLVDITRNLSKTHQRQHRGSSGHFHQDWIAASKAAGEGDCLSYARAEPKRGCSIGRSRRRLGIAGAEYGRNRARASQSLCTRRIPGRPPGVCESD